MSPKKKTEPEPDYSFNNPVDLINRVTGTDYFLPDEKGVIPIPFHWVAGITPLVLVLGDNAAGKSFFRRVVQGVCGRNKTECIHISMEGRRKVAYQPWLTFVYGDEETESTGANSAQMVKSGISTCRSREAPHVVFWDEPDVGLSDSFAAGVGVALREFALKPGAHTKAAFVVTHSKALVEQLVEINPTYVHLGTKDAPPTLQTWLQKPVVPRSIDELFESSRARFKLIQKVLGNR